MSPVNLAALASRADTQLSVLERAKMQEFLRALRTSHDALQNEFVRRWPDDKELTQGGAIGRARADIILQQTGGLVELVQNRLNGLAQGIASSSINDAWQQGIDGALEALRAYDPNTYQSGLAALGVQGTIDTRSMIQAIQGMESNLGRWTSDFISGAQDAVVQSLVSGAHTSTLSLAMAEKFSTTRYNVDRVLRTELHQAQDRARREMYKESNVQYVQRVATQDDRVCFWCAERAGNVYEIDKAPASLHPFDRCFNMPWNPIWEELGLTDNEWVEQHAKDTQAAYNRQVEERRAAGYTVRIPEYDTPAPFDIGGYPPPIIWSPTEGYTEYGRTYIKKNPPYMPPRDDDDTGPEGAPPTETPPTPPTTPSTPSTQTNVLFEDHLTEREAHEVLGQDSMFLNLSQADQDLILKYQSWEYDEINSYLRGEISVLEGWTQAEITRLQEILSNELNYDFVTHRFFTLPKELVSDDLSKMIGTTIENPHFVSTSIRADLPDVLMQDPADGQVNIIARVRVPAGSKGYYTLEDYPWFDDEAWAEALLEDQNAMYELILPPGSNFRVIDARWIQGGNTIELIVDLEQPSFNALRSGVLTTPRLDVIDTTTTKGAKQFFETFEESGFQRADTQEKVPEFLRREIRQADPETATNFLNDLRQIQAEDTEGKYSDIRFAVRTQPGKSEAGTVVEHYDGNFYVEVNLANYNNPQQLRDLLAQWEVAEPTQLTVTTVVPEKVENIPQYSAPVVQDVPVTDGWNPDNQYAFDFMEEQLETGEITLPAAHRTVVNRYTAASGEFNNYLRAGDGDTSQLKRITVEDIQTLQEITSRSTLPVDATLYRSIALDQGALPKNVNDLIGTTLPNIGFSSTTVSEEVAHTFGSKEGVQVLLEIRGRAGQTPGFWVGSYSQAPTDAEFLMPAGMEYKVINVIEGRNPNTGKKMYRLQVEAIMPSSGR